MNRPDPASRPGGRTARVRDQVHQAVRELLLENGFDALSVDAVAVRSGVHRTTVYRRWRDVGGLLADLLDAATAQEWTPPATGTLAGDLVAINHEIHDVLRADPSITGALIAASFRSGRAAAALRQFWADRYRRCEPVVADAVVRGEIPARTDAQRLLIAATAPVYHRMVLLREPMSRRAVATVARDAARAATAGAFSGR